MWPHVRRSPRHHLPRRAALPTLLDPRSRRTHASRDRHGALPARGRPREALPHRHQVPHVRRDSTVCSASVCPTHARTGRGIGYDYVHTAIDDHSRLAYAEIHADERGTTCAGFLTRAAAFYAAHGITIERVLSDNAKNYRQSFAFRDAAEALGIRLKFIKPHCPWTNGKAERLNRTLAAEWAYARPYNSNIERAHALPTWLKHYNLERPHTGIGGLRPIDRINNVPSQYI